MADPTAGTYACEKCGGLIFHEAPAFPLCDNCASIESDKKAARAMRKAAKEDETGDDKDGAPSQQINPADPSTVSESGKVNPNQQDKPLGGSTDSSAVNVGTPESRPSPR